MSNVAPERQPEAPPATPKILPVEPAAVEEAEDAPLTAAERKELERIVGQAAEPSIKAGNALLGAKHTPKAKAVEHKAPVKRSAKRK